MKVVLTVFVILLILFLSDQIKITVVKSTDISVTVELTLFSVVFFTNGGGSPKIKRILSKIRPAVRALAFLLKRSSVFYSVTRISSDTYIPIYDVAISLLLFSASKSYKFKESFDPSLSSDEISLSLSTNVIILLFSLILFVYYSAANAIRRGIRNVG